MTTPEGAPPEDLDRGPGEVWASLLEAATEARDNAHAPYSRFKVGAAVRASSGRIYSGCNVENASYGLTVCAERVAIWKAISHGETRVDALAVVSDSGATPCGACRQVMAEFAADIPVLVADMAGHQHVHTLAGLFPDAFTPDQIESAGDCAERTGD